MMTLMLNFTVKKSRIPLGNFETIAESDIQRTVSDEVFEKRSKIRLMSVVANDMPTMLIEKEPEVGIFVGEQDDSDAPL